MLSRFALPSLLCALSAYAQSSPASSLAQTTPSASQASATGASAATAPAQSENLAAVVDYLIPTASITSLSPEQSSRIASDAGIYFSQYTASHPVSALVAAIAADEAANAILGSGTTPSPEQIASIQGLVGAAPTALVADPSGFVSSANALVNPFPFASIVQSYENGLVDGLRTVVASDVSLSLPAPSQAGGAGGAASTSSKAGAARPTGVLVGGVVAAVGVVGAALL